MEEEIIQPISKEVLRSELTPEKLLRTTNKSHNDIYVVTAHNAPNVMREIGRLREIAFRAAGGGTGKAVDIDEFDTSDNCYKQLIVWNPEAEEIIGGYRYLFGRNWRLNADGQPELATSHMFHFSDRFLQEYMPYTVELGRSFVSLDYQNVRKNSKSIFALDNLWDGLGALTVINPDVRYFFGKMTMYPSYIRIGRDMILDFLKEALRRQGPPHRAHPPAELRAPRGATGQDLHRAPTSGRTTASSTARFAAWASISRRSSTPT